MLEMKNLKEKNRPLEEVFLNIIFYEQLEDVSVEGTKRTDLQLRLHRKCPSDS